MERFRPECCSASNDARVVCRCRGVVVATLVPDEGVDGLEVRGLPVRLNMGDVRGTGSTPVVAERGPVAGEK